jgi:hypothetical protein
LDARTREIINGAIALDSTSATNEICNLDDIFDQDDESNDPNSSMDDDDDDDDDGHLSVNNPSQKTYVEKTNM